MYGHFTSYRGVFALGLLVSISIFFACGLTMAKEEGAPIPPEKFSDDYYKVYGTPNLTISLDSSRLYQGENSSLFLTVANWGRVTSFQVNEEPGANKREEIIAAEREQELEKLRTTAQDVSVRLRAENESAIDITRSVAYPGNIREGQISARLAFPIEVYANVLPGKYRLYADINYTYQRDVSVKGDEDRPETPDVFYWYEPLSQTVPLTLNVERRSDAEFKVLNITPEALQIGSKGNVVKVVIENIGQDTARDLVVRLRPESGIYVSTDESPISALAPGKKAELIYKVDVSKDAVSGRSYMLKLLFDFSDSYRDDLTDKEHAYISIKPGSNSWLAVGILAVIVVAVALIALRKRRSLV